MKQRVLTALSAVLIAIGGCVAADKSSTPLSPSIAGPIPGVNITAPRLLDPTNGSRVAVDTQPIALTLENASTNGVRPLNYVFEIASDIGFANKVFTREGISPGTGLTILRLPDALAPERTYFWRGKAQDGANTGPYSPPVMFNVYTPVVIGKPDARSPTGSITSLQPRFVIGNAPRSGPVTAMAYVIEVSDSDAFANKIGLWAVDERPGETGLDSPISLPASKQLFWRTQAYDSTTAGPWSDTRVFKTPAGGSTGGGSGGGSTCGQTAPLAILQCRRGQFGPTMSSSDMVNFLTGSARDFNAAGVPEGPFGILRKGSGSNCLGYSCDILCSGQGNAQKQWDVLIDAEPDRGPAIPVWGGAKTAPNIRIDTCEIQ